MHPVSSNYSNLLPVSRGCDFEQVSCGDSVNEMSTRGVSGAYKAYLDCPDRRRWRNSSAGSMGGLRGWWS